METMAQRCRSIRLAAGLSQKALARSAGVTYQMIQAVERGQTREPRKLLDIARALGVRPEWLAQGEGPQAWEAVRKEMDLSYEDEGVEKDGGGAGNGFIRIPSAALTGHREWEVLALQGEWLRQYLGLDPEQVGLVVASGDAMSPAIREGDLMVVDLRVRKLERDGIYVLRLQGELSPRRVQWDVDGSAQLLCDNPLYERRSVTPDKVALLSVAGRVAWTGHKL